jgi:hypothetical protein
MRADLLHVVTAVSNPIRWASRIKLAKDFIDHMLDSGVHLTVVECQYGQRPFDLQDIQGIQHIGVRSRTLVWNKECLLNIGAAQCGGAYIGFFDADIKFRKPGWAAEVVHALQQYDVIQPWADCYDLGPDDDHLQTHKSLFRLWATNQPILQGPNAISNYEFGHPGYALAFTRQALDWVGGLITTAILGAADHHMCLALLGKVLDSVPGNLTPAYSRPLLAWQARALHHIGTNVSYLPGTIEHAWHGNKDKRYYVDRWKILADHHFDPDMDLKVNSQGVVELAGNKPELRRAVDAYFRSRDEDSNTLG